MDHGIPLNGVFYLWSVGIPVVFCALSLGFRALNWWPEKARKGSRASDIMAFQLVAGACLAYLGTVGCVVWFGLNPDWDMAPLIKDRFYGHADFVETHLLLPMLAYQFWQVAICFVLADLYDVAMIGHHTVTFGLAYVCLRPTLQYYVCFYFGLAEITNIPLTIIDTFKYFPELGERYAALKSFCKMSFALLFFVIRIFYWTYVTFYMLPYIYPKLFDPVTESPPVIAFFLFAAAFLTGLQWLWGYKIYHLVVNDDANNRRHKEMRDKDKAAKLMKESTKAK
jgi:hypothetical protein